MDGGGALGVIQGDSEGGGHTQEDNERSDGTTQAQRDGTYSSSLAGAAVTVSSRAKRPSSSRISSYSASISSEMGASNTAAAMPSTSSSVAAAESFSTRPRERVTYSRVRGAEVVLKSGELGLPIGKDARTNLAGKFKAGETVRAKFVLSAGVGRGVTYLGSSSSVVDWGGGPRFKTTYSGSTLVRGLGKERLILG